MNKWRLLLFALIAVLYPKPSLTERNVFDGRQCCERRLHPLLHSTKSTIDGSFHSTATALTERRINRDEIRKLSELEKTLNRQTERPERREDSLSRFRSDRRLKTNNERSGRLLERNNRGTIYLESENRRLGRERFVRDAKISQTLKNLDSRNRLSRDERRNTRFNTERARNSRTVEVERTVALKDKRNDNKRQRSGMGRRDSREGNIRQIYRDEISGNRRAVLRTRETRNKSMERKLVAMDRRSIHLIESRRSASLPTIMNNIRNERDYGDDHDIRTNFNRRQIRVNENRQVNENRITRNQSNRQRFHRKSTRSYQRDSLSERTTVHRADRFFKIQSRDTAQNRLEIKQGTATRRVVSRRMDRDLTINRNREIMERETADSRIKPLEVRGNLKNLEQIESRKRIDWQNIVYTIQGIYLCGLFMQMMNIGTSGKSKLRTLRWWVPSTTFIKVE